MARRFDLLPDGSGQVVQLEPGPYTKSPPKETILFVLSDEDVQMIAAVLAPPPPPVVVPEPTKEGA